jgi:hypothetical protein
MSWLIVAWYLTLGIVPKQSETIYEQADVAVVKLLETAYVAELGVNAEAFKCLRLYGSAEIYEYHGSGLSFLPYRGDFKIGAALFFGPIEIGIDHECDHGIVFTNQWLDKYGSSETRITVTIKGKTEF